MTHYRPSPGGGIPGGAVRLGVLVLFSLLVFCFCSLLPAVLLASFVFNALILGSGLFATLAQEREKRTIDALRLTQLSSLDILLLKSHGELRRWALGNAAFLALTVGAAWHGSDPMEWALAGGLALAAGGLLSIALALAVSTRSETTSSAVVGGWVCKGSTGFLKLSLWPIASSACSAIWTPPGWLCRSVKPPFLRSPG
jgi:hypothetical protein